MTRWHIWAMVFLFLPVTANAHISVYVDEDKCSGGRAKFFGETSFEQLRAWLESLRLTSKQMNGKFKGSTAWQLQERNVLDQALRNGSEKAAQDDFDAYFLRAEAAYFKIDILRQKLNKVTGTERMATEETLQEQLKVFGKSFLTYETLRQHLEKVAADEACTIGNCRIKAQSLLAGKLGLDHPTTFADIVYDLKQQNIISPEGAYQRPSLETMRNSFNEEFFAEARKASLRWERWKGVSFLLAQFFSRPPIRTGLYAAATYLEKTPGASVHVPALRALLKESFNISAKTNHFTPLIELERSQDRIEQKVERLLALEASDPEILLTFARKTDSRGLWVAIKGHIKDLEVYRDLYEKMEAFEKPGSAAKTLGNIAPDYVTSVPNILLDWLLIYGGYYTISSLMRGDDPEKKSNATLAMQIQNMDLENPEASKKMDAFADLVERALPGLEQAQSTPAFSGKQQFSPAAW